MLVKMETFCRNFELTNSNNSIKNIAQLPENKDYFQI